ncbi:hypothetical protein RB195_020918 [Necator americanus]
MDVLKEDLRDALQLLEYTPLFEQAEGFYLQTIDEAEKLDLQLSKDSDVLRSMLEENPRRVVYRMEKLKKQYEERCDKSSAAGTMSNKLAVLRSRVPQPAADGAATEELEAGDQDEEDMAVVGVVRSHKDPLGGGLIKDPVKSKHCGHVYDRATLQQYISDNRARHNACYQCPYSLCPSKKNMDMKDMVDCPEFLLS